MITRASLADEMMASAKFIGGNFVASRIMRLGAERHAQIVADWKAKPRILGPKFSKPTGKGVPLDVAAYWLDICAPLAFPASDDDHESRRGWVIACRLTGLGWGWIECALADTRHSGSARASAAWAAFMKEPDERYIGALYAAHVVGRPGVVKVGFSTNVPKRMKALSRREGAEVVAIHHHPATMLHEWAMHMQLRFPIKSEWYPREQIPSWLLGVQQCEAA